MPIYWDDRVFLTLSNLAQETETRASGRVQVISLADFRAAVGDLWEQYESRILIIAESTIARMIGKGNTVIPHGEEAWLLLLPNLPEDKAQQRADAIAASIGEKLLGAKFTTHEIPLPAASRLDLTEVLNSVGSVNMEAVKIAVSRARQAKISAVTTSKRSPRATATSIAAAAPSSADQLKPYFSAAWCAETGSIDSFFFRAGSEADVNIYADSGSFSSDATILSLTKTATRAFTTMCDEGLMAKLSIPVPFRMLHGPTLQEIQRLIASLSQRDRLMRLRSEVVQIPREATTQVLVPIRELFRPYVRDVAFMIDLLSPHDQIMALDHVILGTDVTDAAQIGEEELFQKMLMFRQRAERRTTYVLGLRARSHLRRAINAGIAEVGGPALEDNVRRLPTRVAVLRREELLAP